MQLGDLQRAKSHAKADHKAWSRARAKASERPVLKISGLSGSVADCVNGVFELQAEASDEDTGPPVFQKRGDPDIWIYHTSDKHWWISDAESKNQREPSGYAYSKVANAGSLPADTKGWWISSDRCSNKWEFRPAEVVAYSVTEYEEALAAAWQKAYQQALGRPLLDVSGAQGKHAGAINGTYELHTGEEEADDASAAAHMAFRHSDGRHWLYLSSDSAWWISTADSKAARAGKGWAHSEALEPGTLPTAARTWRVSSGHSSWEVQELQIAARLPPEACDESGAEDAAAPPADEAPETEQGPALALVVSGAAGDAAPAVNGTYLATAASGPEAALTLQKREDPTKWLYLAQDGAWWIGGAAAKDTREADGWARSPRELGASADVQELAVAASGCWEVKRGSRWQFQTLHLVARPLSAVQAAQEHIWKEASDEASALTAVEICLCGGKSRAGVQTPALGPAVVGLYVPAPVEHPGLPPAFRKQADPDTWLYLARNRTWWVGSTASKEARVARGWARSRPVEPGTLPAAAGGWRLLPQGGAARGQEAAEAEEGALLEVRAQAGVARSGLWELSALCCANGRGQAHASLWEAQVLRWKEEEEKQAKPAPFHIKGGSGH